jgi:PDZ domain
LLWPAHRRLDRLIADWRRVRPDLDVTPLGIITRVERARGHFDAELEFLFAEYTLSGPKFAVLVTLAPLNELGGVSGRRLMDGLGLSSGTISVRMDRIVQQCGRTPGWTPTTSARAHKPHAAWSGIVRPSCAPARTTNDACWPACRSRKSRCGRRCCEDCWSGSRTANQRRMRVRGLGMTLSMTLPPAHVTIAMRRAVGPRGDIGLLVLALSDGGAAVAAGIRQGDVLVDAGNRELRSDAALYAALDDASASRDICLTILRGATELALDLTLPEVDVSWPRTRPEPPAAPPTTSTSVERLIALCLPNCSRAQALRPAAHPLHAKIVYHATPPDLVRCPRRPTRYRAAWPAASGRAEQARR